MKRFNIRTLERLSGIRASTIRIWELRYGLLQPGRNAGGQRLYTIDEARLLTEIAILCRQGGRISGLAAMTNEERQQRLDALTDPEALLEYAQIRLVTSIYQFDTAGFNQVLRAAAQQFGPRRLIILLLGLLEVTGISTVRQPETPERWVLARSRQYFSAVLENAGISESEGEHFILFLPAGAPPDYLLLGCAAHISASGRQVTWMGSGLSERDIRSLCQRWPSATLLTYFSSAEYSASVLSAGGRLLAIAEEAQRGMPSLAAALALLRTVGEPAVTG